MRVCGQISNLDKLITCVVVGSIMFMLSGLTLINIETQKTVFSPSMLYTAMCLVSGIVIMVVGMHVYVPKLHKDVSLPSRDAEARGI